MLQRLAGEDVAFDLALSTAVGCVRVDPHQFEQVIVNLVVNARDVMPAGGTLRIATDRAELRPAEARGHPALGPGAYVRLRGSGTGAGSPPEVMAHIFEHFFTTYGPGRGTGL